MKSNRIAALAALLLLVAGCNRPSSDQGGAGQAASDSRHGSGSQSRSTEPLAQPAVPPGPDARINPPAPALSTTEEAAKPADNTGKNVRDRTDATVTPGDQSESKTDLELTRRIRRTITENNQFSTTAKNIKIVTANGKVTLRGPVNTAAEREQIAQLVQGAAGAATVDNQLEVKNNQ